MKKFAVLTIVGALLLTFGQAFAAVAPVNEASHELEIIIPDVLMIRIDAGESASTRVTFDYGSEFDTYFKMLEGGADGDLKPTQQSFENISVFANRASWTVNVTAKGHELVNQRISVQPAKASDYVLGAFKLNGDLVAQGKQTQGWRPLGISGADYRLFVDGTEPPGTYTATVTYSITAP